MSHLLFHTMGIEGSVLWIIIHTEVLPEGRVKDAWLVKVQMEPVMEPLWPGL